MPMKVDFDENVKRGLCKAAPRMKYKILEMALEQNWSEEVYWEANVWNDKNPGAIKPSTWDWSSENKTWWSASWDATPSPETVTTSGIGFAHPHTEHANLHLGEEWVPEPIHVQVPLKTLFHQSFPEIHELFING